MLNGIFGPSGFFGPRGSLFSAETNNARTAEKSNSDNLGKARLVVQREVAE